jgi:ribosomal protein S18 acetylase RimI-like enzyme
MSVPPNLSLHGSHQPYPGYCHAGPFGPRSVDTGRASLIHRWTGESDKIVNRFNAMIVQSPSGLKLQRFRGFWKFRSSNLLLIHARNQLMSGISIERITAVDDEIMETATRLTPQLGSPYQVALTRRYLERVVANPNHYWLMARRAHDRRIVGMASLFILHMATNVRGMLENVVVDKDARRSRVGLRLCVEARRIAAERGAKTIRATAAATNIASRHTLEKAGFVLAQHLHHLVLYMHSDARMRRR